MSKWVTVTKKSEIPPGQTRAFRVEDLEIAISHVKDSPHGEAFFAFENKCSHMDFPLDDGLLEDSSIECAHHGAKFDVKTGRVLCMPAVTPIQVYPLRIKNDDIEVDVEGNSGD